jgi:hypothetical protein
LMWKWAYSKAVTWKSKEMGWEDNIMIDLREIICEDWKWLKLAHDYVHWWSFVLVVRNFWILLPRTGSLCVFSFNFFLYNTFF